MYQVQHDMDVAQHPVSGRLNFSLSWGTDFKGLDPVLLCCFTILSGPLCLGHSRLSQPITVEKIVQQPSKSQTLAKICN